LRIILALLAATGSAHSSCGQTSQAQVNYARLWMETISIQSFLPACTSSDDACKFSPDDAADIDQTRYLLIELVHALMDIG